MKKNKIEWNDLPVHFGFIVDGHFIMCCAFCHQWHSLEADDSLKKGLRAFSLSKCNSKKSPYYDKIIPIQIFSDAQERLLRIAFAQSELNEYINYESSL